MPPEADPTPELKPDLGGYPSVEALLQGYRASSAEAKKWRDQAEALDREFQNRANAPNARPEIPNRDPFSRLAEYGIPPDELRQAIRNELGPMVQDTFAPLARGFEARNQILAQHSDYAKFESDVAQFIQQDPQLSQSYNRMFQADPVAAMEYAYLKFGDSRRRTVVPQPENGRQDAVHAAIPSTRSGGTRSEPADEQLRQQAWEHFKQTGQAEPFARLRLRQVIPDEFLNQ